MRQGEKGGGGGGAGVGEIASHVTLPHVEVTSAMRVTLRTRYHHNVMSFQRQYSVVGWIGVGVQVCVFVTNVKVALNTQGVTDVSLSKSCCSCLCKINT